MRKKGKNSEASPWKTISAEELAEARRQAIRDRLAGPRGWLDGLFNVLSDDLEREIADHSIDATAREFAETSLQTLQHQAPALIRLLDRLPSASRDGALSMLFHLLLAVRGRTSKTSDKYVRDVQAERARQGSTASAAGRQKIAAQYDHLPVKEALPLINADLKSRRLKTISPNTLYEYRRKSKTDSHS